MAKKEVAAAPKSDVPVQWDFGDDEAGGFGNQTMDYIKPPILEIIQRGTPADKRPEGAEDGDVYNTVTGDLYKKAHGLGFCPAMAEHVYTEWVPRDMGGGFKGTHRVTSADVIQAKNDYPGQLKLSIPRLGKSGTVNHDLVETFQLWGNVFDLETDEVLYPAMIAFTSTKINIFQKWNSRIRILLVPGAGRKVNPPMWAHLLKLTTKHVPPNQQGYEWETWVLNSLNGDMKGSLVGPSDGRYVASRELATMIEAGQVEADFSGVTSDGGTTPANLPTGDKPPF